MMFSLALFFGIKIALHFVNAIVFIITLAYYYIITLFLDISTLAMPLVNGL
jgi:hypothetical protein